MKFNMKKFSNCGKVDMNDYFILSHKGAEEAQDMYFQGYPEKR